MKYESCRKCGIQLQESKDEAGKCLVCGESIRLVCPKCNRQNDIQIHQHIYDKIISVNTPTILSRDKRN